MTSISGIIRKQMQKRYWISYYRDFNKHKSTSAKDERNLKLTESCIKRVDEICTEDNSFIRVMVDGGGCSGFQYKFQIVNKTTDDDLFVGPNNRVVIDSISLDYCAGATMDYQVELIRSGFQIINNPKAEQGCSCGSSFALKLD